MTFVSHTFISLHNPTLVYYVFVREHCMPAAKTLRTKITQAVVTSCLRNRNVRQIVKDTELRGLRLEIGPLSASWVLEYRPQGLLEDVRRPFSKSYKFGDVHVRGFVHEVIIGCGNDDLPSETSPSLMQSLLNLRRNKRMRQSRLPKPK